VPMAPRRIAGGLWAYSSCHPLTLVASQFTGWLAGRHVALVPGRGREWQPPIATNEWRAWLDRTRAVIGPFENWVVQLPADPRRRRFSLLLLDRAGAPAGHAKFATAKLRPLSIKAQELLTAEPPTTFWTPKLLGCGYLAEWSYTLTSAMPQVRHRPASLDASLRRYITGEIQHRLADLNVSQGPEFGIHGDFGPWNVRRLSTGRIAVIDWEDVRLGPPVADELWHALHSALLRQRNGKKAAFQCRRELSFHDQRSIVEAGRYWVTRLEEPEPDDVEDGARLSAGGAALLSQVRIALDELIRP